MVTSSDINRLSTQVGNNAAALNERNRSLTSSVSKANSSWRGRINGAFRNSHKNTQTKLNRLVTNMGNLRTRLGTLSTAMTREEREDKRAV